MRYAHGLLTLATAGILLAPATPAGADKAETCRGEKATIVGTPGEDDLVGTPGDDVIAGLGGIDDIRGRGGDDLICGGPGPAREDEGGTIHIEHLDGGPGDDLLVGGPGADHVDGARGDDDLRGGANVDELHGHGGRDRLSGGDHDDDLSGGTGADQVRGGDGDDALLGDDGLDILVGEEGDDLLDGGPGDDGLDGGAGFDTADYRYGSSIGQHQIPVTVDLPAGRASAPTYFGTDALAAIEGARTSGGSDTLVGDEGDNEFSPGAPWYDGAVEDHVDGGGGRDHLTFAYDGHVAPVTVDLAAGTGSQQGGTLTVTGIEDVTGTFHDDVLIGDEGPNRLAGAGLYYADLLDQGDRIDGGGGDDDLFGTGGDDDLDGGPGTNTIDGGPGEDTCRNPLPGQMGATGCEI